MSGRSDGSQQFPLARRVVGGTLMLLVAPLPLPAMGVPVGVPVVAVLVGLVRADRQKPPGRRLTPSWISWTGGLAVAATLVLALLIPTFIGGPAYPVLVPDQSDNFDDAPRLRAAPGDQPRRATDPGQIARLIERLRALHLPYRLHETECTLPTQVQYRGIAAAALGVPTPSGGADGAGQSPDTWQAGSFNVEVRAPTGAVRGGGNQGAGPAGGYVAFYAARAGEPAPEEKLPDQAADARWYGLLTRRLGEALAATHQAGRATSYRRLGERIRQGYAGRQAPNPLFDGPGLDVPVLGGATPGTVERALQWPIIKKTYPPGIHLPVGRLAQIGPGSRLALLARPDDETAQALGIAEVGSAQDLSAELRPIAADGKPALESGAIPADAYARLVHQAIDFEVRVARPALPADANAAERAAAGLIERLAVQPAAEGIRLR